MPLWTMLRTWLQVLQALHCHRADVAVVGAVLSQHGAIPCDKTVDQRHVGRLGGVAQTSNSCLCAEELQAPERMVMKWLWLDCYYS